MTREEAIKKRDEQIADIREWVRNSDDAWEYGAVLSVIDEIVDEIKLCDKRIEALQERPKGRGFELPCELGDTVYIITSAYNLGLSNIDKTPCIYEGIVKGVMFHENLNHQIRLYSVKNIIVWYEKLADFGKTVFLTQEEAEKELADMRESEQE